MGGWRTGEEVRRDRMDSEVCDWALRYRGNLEASLHFRVLIGTTDSYLSFPPLGIWGNGVSFGPDWKH